MTSLRRFLKHSMVANKQGASVGRPADVLIDPSTHSVALVVLAYGKVPETSTVCKASDISSFAEDALVVPDLKVFHLAVHDTKSLDKLHAGRSIPGRMVYSSTGHRLGRIHRIEVDDKGQVTNYGLRQARLGLFRPLLDLTPAQIGDLTGETVVATPAATPSPPKEGMA